MYYKLYVMSLCAFGRNAVTMVCGGEVGDLLYTVVGDKKEAGTL